MKITQGEGGWRRKRKKTKRQETKNKTERQNLNPNNMHYKVQEVASGVCPAAIFLTDLN